MSDGTSTDGGFGRSLAGVRVLDLTRNLAGPYCTMTLGDLGADVIKVERPDGGDDTRHWAPPAWGGQSTVFLTMNRNKRSIALDLDDDEGAAVARRLAEGADVLVESFRPGALERRGLGWEALRDVNPGLVYCSISGFGGRGPLRERPAYDPAIQAYSGLMDMTGEPDQAPVRVGTGIVDLSVGMWATIAVLAALRERDAGGGGAHVETSLFESGAAWMTYHVAGYLGTGEVPHRQGSGTTMIAPYEVFAASDGDMFVGGPNNRIFRRLLEACDLLEHEADPRFRTNGERVANRHALHDLLQARIRERPVAEWLRAFTAAGIPHSPVRSADHLVEDEQLAALGMLAPLPHPDIPDLRLMDMPISRGGGRASLRLPPPALGQHTDAVLGELGYTPEDVAALRSRGAVG
jgi:crotonobetainyl-CoA:carnitine CoA-transferase CaiB-like acyl-CoA transferase